MYFWVIGVKMMIIIDVIIGKILLFGNEVNYVKLEVIDIFFSLKFDDVFYFFLNLWIFLV